MSVILNLWDCSNIHCLLYRVVMLVIQRIISFGLVVIAKKAITVSIIVAGNFSSLFSLLYSREHCTYIKVLYGMYSFDFDLNASNMILVEGLIVYIIFLADIPPLHT